MTTARPSPEGRRDLGHQVRAPFRTMLLGISVMLVLTGAVLGWLVAWSEPQVDRMQRLLTAVQDTHVALVDQETGLRAYVATGQATFLQPYIEGVARARDGNALIARIGLQGAVAADMLADRLAQQQWQDDWVTVAADPVAAARLAPRDERTRRILDGFFTRGKALFDAYRVTEERLLADARGEARHARDRQIQVLIGLCLALLGTGGALVVSTARRRDALDRSVVGPVATLLDTVHDVAAGRLVAPPAVDGPTELVELRDGLATMISSLAEERRSATDREARAEATSQRQAKILVFAREVSGSTSLRYVLDAVGATASALTNSAQARVWLRAEAARRLSLAYDSDTERKTRVPHEDRELGSGTAGRAAQLGRTCRSSDPEAGQAETGRGEVVALPLVVGARVVGVLEVIGTQVEHGGELMSLMETLASHTATAMEAARLYEQADTLSSVDGLTGLANRRRLDEDLALEVQRAMRYGRPLAVLLLDLDHFKRLNDTYGHLHGDAALQETAAVLRDGVRASDSVYRYGGEEIVVLLRDTDAAGAEQLADRLRAAVEEHFSSDGTPTLTVSGGLASVPAHATSPTAVIGAADQALYRSKAQGRNRISLAPDPGPGGPVLPAPAPRLPR